MKKRFLIMAICAIIAIGLASPLSAQNVYTDGVGVLESNTSKATAGIFGNDVDDYINYHDYSNVLNGAKWFSFLSGKTDFDGVLDAGYARNIGKVYLGVWYRGNIFRSSDANETHTIIPVYSPTNLGVLDQVTNRTTYQEAYNETANNFEFLVGIFGHGIKVGVFESTSSNKNEGAPGAGRAVEVVTDYRTGITRYNNAIDEYEISQSYIKPYLGWGSTFRIASMSIRPYADIGFGIFSATQTDNYSSYDVVNGVRRNVVNTIGAGYSGGYLQPNGKVGAWLDFAKKGTVQQSVGISYALSIYLYDDDAQGFGGPVGGPAQYINRVTDYTDRTEVATDITYTFYEQSKSSHTITPAYKVTAEPGENLKVGFAAALPIAFGSESEDQYTKRIRRTATSYKNGQLGNVDETNTLNYPANRNIEESTFGINLELALGGSYQLVPNRFGINAGITASPIRYLQTVNKIIPRTAANVETHTVIQQDGSVTTNTVTVTHTNDNDQVSESSVWQQYTATLGAGFTFNFNEHAAIDLAAQSGNFTANDFNLDLTTVNVIFTVKY